MPMDWHGRLAERRAAGLYRRRRTVSDGQSVSQIVDGRRLLTFCSNDYLGLAADPRLSEALRQAAKRYGVGSGAAHLINGHSVAHHALEEALADFVGAERALLFSTGYMANLGVLSALLKAGDTVIQDKLNHASFIDGARLSQAHLKRYRHNDMASLQRALRNATGDRLIASDGVFSMDGDVAPIRQLQDLAEQNDALLMIDDAHGFGVLGEQGRGSVNAAAAQTPIYMATLGKAIGVAGAFVAGSADLIEILIQDARSYVYTTAMPAALAEASCASLSILKQEQWRRDHLQDLIQYFRQEAARLALTIMPSSTPIQPVLLGEAETALAWSQALEQQGILVTAIRPPTVPKGQARLRITFSASHQTHHVERLLAALANCQKTLSL
jgi:8-amino-7-oxononanoate synthase